MTRALRSNRPKSSKKKTLPQTRRTASYRETERRFSVSSPLLQSLPPPSPHAPARASAAPEDRRYGRHRALAAGLCLPNGPADSPSPAAEGRDPPPSPRGPAPPQPPRRGGTGGAGARCSHGNSTHHGRRAAGEVRPTRQRAGAEQDSHSPPAEGDRGAGTVTRRPLHLSRTCGGGGPGSPGTPRRLRGRLQPPAQRGGGRGGGSGSDSGSAVELPRRGQPLPVRADVPTRPGH